MTTTVKRGAGRPAANAKTTRHAQRTPLPPRDGEPVPTTAPAKTTRARRAAVTGSEETPNPVRPAGTCRLCGKAHRQGSTIEQRHSAEFKAARTSETAEETVAKPTGGTRKAASAPASKGRSTAGKGKAVAALPEDFPGRAKPMRLLDGEAQAHGWVGRIVSADPKTGAIEVELSKDGATMTWYGIDGKQDPNQNPKWSDGSRTVTMKNISAILMQATGERLSVKPTGQRRAPSSPAVRKGADTPQRSLPFDPAGATDEEIVSALRGSQITWTNKLSQAVESAVIATRARIKIEEHPATGGRMVTFNDPTNTGTRTVLVERLLTVK